MGGAANFHNEATAATLSETYFFANDKMEEDAGKKTRRCLLAPYGDWPNARGMQRFQEGDAKNIADWFNNPMTRLVVPKGNGSRTIQFEASNALGLPFYEGHPDHPDFKGKPGHTNVRAVGRIKSLEAGKDGLYANVKFSSEGERLIADEAYHGHSVNWYLKPEGGVFRPFCLKSVGFTNDPNIPVPSVTTANAAVDTVCERRFSRMALMRTVGAANAQFGNSGAPFKRTIIENK